MDSSRGLMQPATDLVPFLFSGSRPHIVLISFTSPLDHSLHSEIS